MIFSIDGNIGSGKSTIVRQLKILLEHDQNIIFLEEPVNEWSEIKSNDGTTILEKFYTNQDKYAFSFQMMAYISRLAPYEKTLVVILLLNGLYTQIVMYLLRCYMMMVR